MIGASLSEPHIDVKSAIFSICIIIIIIIIIIIYVWYDGPLFLNVCGAARYL